MEWPSPDLARRVLLPRVPHSRARIMIEMANTGTTEGPFSKACVTASTTANLAATVTTTSNPMMRTTSVPTRTATGRAFETLHPTNNTTIGTIEAETSVTSSRVCGTASTIASTAATATIISNPMVGATSVPTERATSKAFGIIHPI